jgi:hypothetical protein
LGNNVTLIEEDKLRKAEGTFSEVRLRSRRG